MGERVIKCCCMTGSTDAATDVVERATFRKTFNAIQSLRGQHLGYNLRGNQLDTHSKNSFRIWYAPKVGSLRIVYEVGVSERNRLRRRFRTRSLMTWLVTYPHRIRTLRELIVPLSSGPEPALMRRSQHLSAHAIMSRTGSALLARLSITPRNSTSSN